MSGILQAAAHTWRIFGNAVCYAIFGIGALCLSAVYFRMLALFIRDPRERERTGRRAISAAFRFFLRVSGLLGVFDVRFEDFERIGGDRGVIIAANHPSLLDYVFVASRLGEVDCLVKADLERNWFLKGVVGCAGYLVNNRHEELLAEAAERLARGSNILVFPEGTRTVPGQPMKLRRGCANMALRCGCDIRLVHISCTEHYLTKQAKWYQIPRRRPRFTLRAGDLISISGFIAAQPRREPSIMARRLTEELSRRLGAAAGGGDKSV